MEPGGHEENGKKMRFMRRKRKRRIKKLNISCTVVEPATRPWEQDGYVYQSGSTKRVRSLERNVVTKKAKVVKSKIKEDEAVHIPACKNRGC